jgi:hypothetical protein
VDITGYLLRCRPATSVSGLSSARDPDEIFTIVLYQVEKRVIGLDDPNVDIPDKDADDVGLDQRLIRFAFARSLACTSERAFPRFRQARFHRDHRLAGEGLEKRDLFVVERSDLPSPDQNYSMGAPSQQRRRKRGTMGCPRVLCRRCPPNSPLRRDHGHELSDGRCGSSHHPVRFAGRPRGMDSHRNCPVRATNRRRLRAEDLRIVRAARRAAFSATASSTD